jgi:hypothetical protein
MPLDGTLKDLSLPNLVQLQCTEQKRARVKLKQGKAEGELVFVNGELIYAAVGPWTGDNAVYELLIWSEASFHVSDDSTALPLRNVEAPWQTLVLEGLRRADEVKMANAQIYSQIGLALGSGPLVTHWHLCTVDGMEINSEGESNESATASWVAIALQNQMRLGDALQWGGIKEVMFVNAKEKWFLVPFGRYWIAAETPANATAGRVREALTRVART